MSAVRNLNNVDVGGRPLRIDLADSDPFLEGKTTVRGEILDGGFPGPSEPRAQWRTPAGRLNDVEAFLANVPPGIHVPKGSSVLDSISQTLASMPPNQLMEVLAQMKAFVITHPEQARTLLIKHPQLSYALFQALLLNKIVDSVILERMLASSRGPNVGGPSAPPLTPQTSGRPPMHVPPPHLQHHNPGYPPQMPPFPPQGLQHPQPMPAMQPPMSISAPPAAAMFAHHQQGPPMPPPMGQPQQYYRPPPAPVQAPPPPVQQQPSAQPQAAATAEINETQRAMLLQVLNLPQEQIDAMAETERNAILQLRARFMSTLGSGGS